MGLSPECESKLEEVKARLRGRPVNPDLLEAYVLAWSRWKNAEEWLSDPNHGPVITIRDDKGNVKVHGIAPQVKVSESASREMARLAAALNI